MGFKNSVKDLWERVRYKTAKEREEIKLIRQAQTAQTKLRTNMHFLMVGTLRGDCLARYLCGNLDRKTRRAVAAVLRSPQAKRVQAKYGNL